MTIFTKFVIFFSAFAPLIGLLAIRTAFLDITQGLQLAGIAALFILIPLLILKVIFRNAQRELVEVKEIKDRNSEIPGFILIYFLPFLQSDLFSLKTLVPLLGLYLVIAFTFVRANAIHINPLFSLACYSILSVNVTEAKNSILVISRHENIKPGDRIWLQADSSMTIGIIRRLGEKNDASKS